MTFLCTTTTSPPLLRNMKKNTVGYKNEEENSRAKAFIQYPLEFPRTSVRLTHGCGKWHWSVWEMVSRGPGGKTLSLIDFLSTRPWIDGNVLIIGTLVLLVKESFGGCTNTLLSVSLTLEILFALDPIS